MRWFAFLLILFFLVAGESAAQTEEPFPQGETFVSDDLTEPEFRAMLGRLSDEQVRAFVIREFAARRATKSGDEVGVLSRVREVGEQLSASAAMLLSRWPELPAAFQAIGARVDALGGYGIALLAFLVSFGSGLAARFFWRRRAAERQLQLAERDADKGAYANLAIIGDAFLFLLIDLSSVLVFAAAGLAALYLFFHHPDMRLLVSSYIAVAVVILVARSIVDLMFPRGWPVYRLIAIDDNATRYLHWLVLGLTAIWAFTARTSELMIDFDAPGGTPHLFQAIVSIAWLVIALIGIRMFYEKTASLLPERGQGGFADYLTRNWAVLVGGIAVVNWSLYMGAALLSGETDASASASLNTIVILIAFWAAFQIAGHYLRARDLDEKIETAVRFAIRALLIAFGVVVLLAIWGVEAHALDSSGLSGLLLRAAIDVGLTALIGWAVWEFVRTLIDVRLAAEQPDDAVDEGSDGEGGLGASRSATLLPLLRSFAFAAIGLTCLFTAASSLGVNVAPLIAGAGVIGLAIGFGAQTLVRDIVSGVFFLIDDAFRRGEYIDLGTAKGRVEQISIRSLQLRHHLGAVHTIPFGEIQTLTNYSRDWVILKLPLRLTFDTDPQAVKKIVKRIGAEMAEDELLGPKLIEPPKSQGVIQMEDSAMILRVKFKSVPGDQFVLRRELLHRIRAAFAEAGIRFASREVTVTVNESADAADRVEAAAAAARRVLEDEQEALQNPATER